MTSTGTFAFANTATSDLVVTAFSRIGMRGVQIGTQAIFDAATESNLMMVDWSNKQPNLWTSDTQSIALVAGTATYTLDITTITPLVIYVRITSGSTYTDRVLAPLSTVDYASIPNKQTQSVPNAFWFNRQVTPQLTLWPIPDQAYTLYYQRVRQLQDVSVANGATIDAPYRWLDAFTAGLAHRLARIYKPEMEQLRKADAQEAWAVAADQDQEFVPLYISPDLSSYFN